MSDAFYFS